MSEGMREGKTSGSSGIGFVGMLTIVFITLKLCKVISWSWWLVLAPIWVLLSVYMVIFLIALIVVKVRK